MKLKLKETELFDLRSVLNSVPVDKIAEDGTKKYKALTLRRYIVKEVEEKNKAFIDKVEKAGELYKKAVQDFQNFKKELDQVDDSLEEKEKKEKQAERNKLLQEQDEATAKKIEKGLADLGLKGLTYRMANLTRFVYIEEKDDKEIEFELLDDKDKNQLEFVKDVIERVALDVYPIEEVVLNLGDKIGV